MLLESCWTALVHFFSFQSLFSFQQYPLSPDGSLERPVPPNGGHEYALPPDNGLEFEPLDTKTKKFQCVYPGLGHYFDPPSEKDRTVWLKHKHNPDKDVSIHTNYEDYAPVGIDRHNAQVFVSVKNDTTSPKNLDGREYRQGKYFDMKYPGTPIEACWGDTVFVHVTNELQENGTAIHMHGIRMLNDSLADGVPGVTQCPIAPGETHTYKFRAVQYGTTWYHSHYSLQYTDGLLGPLTIYGPASTPQYDEAMEPIIIADHNDRSAFEDWNWGVVEGHAKGPIKMDSILINGIGSYQGQHPERRFRTKVDPGKRILLRLINASTDTAYIFSIDEHELEIIGADLVPVRPYKKTHLYIGIVGQRYHVILQTKHRHHRPNYWIRTEPAEHCQNFGCPQNERQGILVYREKYPFDPTSGKHLYSTQCQDENHTKLEPAFRIDVPKPVPSELHKVRLPIKVKKANMTLPAEPENNIGAGPNISAWKVMDAPAWVNYQEPTIKHINTTVWPANAALMEVKKNRDQNKPTWAYMVIDGGHQPKDPNVPKGKDIIPAAHPMHLHGHDFALLKQSYEPLNDKMFGDDKTPANEDQINEFINTFNVTNPPRRDVILLPRDGYVVLAFKILEDKHRLARGIHGGGATHAYEQLLKGCSTWKNWYSSHTPFPHRFQDDSGV
ncbi:multicopper oxidase [Aspergillus piperis CBS 112811]|uniref:Multicopper oxidase n=1 Tax=Aspergillus piperis CBS 112811 TaxID=1448313 RepID=A0A8G1R423_9EURO|nr:multicopper oxidase [Aspergillus piperis CBS 112811]RAH58878.1 multicopper oxidase [Aspergillus piperis CBS 112811]